MVEITNPTGSIPNAASTAKPASVPLPTDIKSLYAEFEKTANTARNRGQKASEIKDIILTVAKEIGKTKLSVTALYRVIKAKYPDKKIDRSYFYNTALKQFESEKDEKEVTWIFTDKEKQKPIPTSA